MVLDERSVLRASVGYGQPGWRGELGYATSSRTNGRVMVGGRHYDNAISAHPPSQLAFSLGGEPARVRAFVALNDDVAGRSTAADFLLLGDGRVLAAAAHVYPCESPRSLEADVTGVQELTLAVDTRQWEHCHAVWLDPEVLPGHATDGDWSDALARVRVAHPPRRPSVQRCIATAASPRYAHLLDDLLGSLAANGSCRDASLVVLAIDDDGSCQRIADRYGALVIPCLLRAGLSPATKSVLYSIASVVDADEYLCLDADMLVLGDLRPVFNSLSALAPDTILIARDAFIEPGPLADQLQRYYRGHNTDFARLLEKPENESSFGLSVNDGLFAGSRRALLSVDNLLRHMAQAISWVDELPSHGWRNQFVFNLALARLRCAVELDPIYNLQLHMNDISISPAGDGFTAQWRGREVRVLHFCGWGRDKYPDYRGVYAKRGPA